MRHLENAAPVKLARVVARSVKTKLDAVGE